MQSKYTDERLREIIASMSVREKAAQMTQLNANIIATDENGDITGPALSMHLTKEDVLAVGSTLNYRGADSMIRMQKEHMAGDPNKIPLAGMMDVIHGYVTAYPIPPNMIRISIGSIHTIPDTATVWNDVSKCADTHSTTAHNAVSARQSAPSERKTKERMGFIVTG